MNTRRSEDSTRPLNPIVSWSFLAAGVVFSALVLLDGSDSVRSFDFDALAIIAAGGAVYGHPPQPPRQQSRVAAPRDRSRTLRRPATSPTTSSPRAGRRELRISVGRLLDLSAYPFIAVAPLSARPPHFRRDTTVDSAIVALAASAVIWQWVVTPVVATAEGATLERIVAAAYPIMDVLLVVVIVHAVFTLPQWVPAAWFLFGALAVMLIADTVYARLVADGRHVDGSPLDALWPIAYFLFAAAVFHPSMRTLWDTQRHRTGASRTGAHDRARRGAVLGAGSRRPRRRREQEAFALTAIVGVTAALVAWRIAKLVSETDRAREVLAESEVAVPRFRAALERRRRRHRRGRDDHLCQPLGAASCSDSSRASLLGHPIVELIHPDDIDRARRAIASLADRPFESESVEVRCLHADGSWRWAETTCTNQMHEPAVRGVVGNFRDVTERRRIEALGARETQVLERILSGAPIPETLHGLMEAVEEFRRRRVGDDPPLRRRNR